MRSIAGILTRGWRLRLLSVLLATAFVLLSLPGEFTVSAAASPPETTSTPTHVNQTIQQGCKDGVDTIATLQQGDYVSGKVTVNSGDATHLLILGAPGGGGSYQKDGDIDFVANGSGDFTGCLSGAQGGSVDVDIYSGEKVPVWSVAFNGKELVRDCEPGATGCAGGQEKVGDSAACGEPSGSQWVDCDNPPDGTPEKVWPIVEVQNTAVLIGPARFRVPQELQGRFRKAEVKATATLDNGSQLTFLTIASDQGSEVVASQLSSLLQKLPSYAAIDMIKIDWKVEVVFNEDPNDWNFYEFDAGHSDHPLYLMYGQQVSPQPFGNTGAVNLDTYYVSLVTMALVDSQTGWPAGQLDTADAVANNIWEQFKDHQVYRYDLDPKTGSVKRGNPLHYYAKWSWSKFLSAGYPADRAGFCRTVLETLDTGVGQCSIFAQMYASMMGLQGLPSQYAALLAVPAWKNLENTSFPISASFMLIGKGAWHFGALASNPPKVRGYLYGVPTPPAYPKLGKYNYVLGGNPAEGNSDPPGLFLLGDHEIARYNNEWYDPSYGTGPYAGIAGWAKASIAGYGTWRPTLTWRDVYSNMYNKYEKCQPAFNPSCTFYANKWP